MTSARTELGFFERWLTLWVLGCIAGGIGVGEFAPGVAARVAHLEIVRLNLAVGALIWAMIVPMLMKVDSGALREVGRHKLGIGVTLLVNRAIKPLSMALFAWIFIRHVFADWLPAGQQDGYVAGLVLLAAAPCTAMVVVWSNPAKGDPNFTLTRVAVNDFIMVFAYAPVVALPLGVASIRVSWGTLLLSVLLYVVMPPAVAQLWRRRLLNRGRHAFDHAVSAVTP